MLQAFYALPTDISQISPRITPWTERALLAPNAFDVNVTAKRKYKPVDRKVRPVPTYMPNPAVQEFKPVKLPAISDLPTHPPSIQKFAPTARLTRERLEMIISKVPKDFLSSAELDLLAHVLDIRQNALAFDLSEKGMFSSEYFPDYEMAVIEHTPWILAPIRLPNAIVDQVKDMLNEQVRNGKFEYSSASYRARQFPVLKKDGSLRLVQDLQPLNTVSIRDSALPPRTDDFAEKFIGKTIYGSADLFSGYDARRLAESSRPLTTFGSPVGPLRSTTLPQGYVNALPEFQRAVNHTLDDEDEADGFSDDVGIRGPDDDYNNATIPGNTEIRQFVYEYATTLNRVLMRFEIAGITASGPKFILATPKLSIVGTVVSHEGWHLQHGLVSKILKWPALGSITDVRAFLGTAGVGRKWIKGFSLIAKPLTSLLRGTEREFVFGPEQQEAQDKLKDLVSKAPVLTKVKYDLAKLITQLPRTSDHGLVVVAVDSCNNGAGWIVYQYNETDKHPVLYGSCTYNETEQRYSQPKCELYGVFRALKELRHRIWGIHFRLEADAKFLAQMFHAPDLPNAAMNRWICYIQLFDFELKHVPAASHKAPDGLSRRPAASDDSSTSDPDEFLNNVVGASSYAYQTDPRFRSIVSSLINNPTRTLITRVEDIMPQSLKDKPMPTLPTDVPYVQLERPGVALHVSQLEDRPTLDEAEHFRQDFDARYDASVFRRNDFHENKDEVFKQFSSLRATHDMVWTGNDFMIRNAGRIIEYTFTLDDGATLTWECPCYADEYITGLYAKKPVPVRFATTSDYEVNAEARSNHRGDYARVLKPHLSDIYELGEWSDVDAYRRWGIIPDRWHEHGLLNRNCCLARIAISCAGHAHGTRKEDDSLYGWLEVRLYLKDGVLPKRCLKDAKAERSFRRRARRFIVDQNDFLFLIDKSPRKPRFLPRRVIEENDKRSGLIAQLHNEVGHRGRDATYVRIRDRYYWPNLYQEVAFFVRSCNACQKNSKTRSIVPFDYKTSSSILRRWDLDTLYMDEGYGGYKYIYHAVEPSINHHEARAERKISATKMANFIYEDIICRYGCPAMIGCDGGPEFKGAVEELLARKRVLVIMSTPYHPEGNPHVERAHQPLLDAIIKLSAHKKTEWPLYVHPALYAMRMTTSRITGCSPFYLLYGQEPVYPCEITDPTWGLYDWDKIKTTSDLIAIRAQQIMRRDEKLSDAFKRQAAARKRDVDAFYRKYEDKWRANTFEVGTWVLVEETWLRKQMGNKLAQRWTGPYVIDGEYGKHSYYLRELDGTFIRHPVNKHRLKIFYFRPDHQTIKTVYTIHYSDNVLRMMNMSERGCRL